MEYRIDPEKIPLVTGKKILKIILTITLMISLLLFWLSQNLNPGKSMNPILSDALPKMVFILLFIGAALYFRFQNYYKSIVFQITNNTVSQHISKKNLNAINKIAAQRNKSRYGSEHNQVIPYALISSISINANRIKIKSINNNFLNGNGAIEIPKETNDFDQLKIHFQKLKEQLRK